ncbi:recombinase family protein, partial [Bacillus cereus]|uniref:recombinase family protein n=3 Tax=Bacillus TaxID=1386 RepID=UPI001443DC31|nr:recombinase family protein [Bacillus cereus]
MKKAVAYLRVSTESQLDKFGLLAQEEAIRTFAEQNNIEIVKSFKEEAVSGSTEVDGRIALVECLDFMAENEGV